MASTSQHSTSGGFARVSLPSPTPSTASSRAAAELPQPRSKPLYPGSRKEEYARDYVSKRLMHISRRFVKKHGIPDPNDLVSGYDSFDEVCKDLDEVVDVLWFCSTPSLQVPFLLDVALAVTEYLTSFPPRPRPTFALLKKLDHIFASLLLGRDVHSNQTLPAFERAAHQRMSRTDMVRCKGLVEETRLQIAMMMSGEDDVDTYLPEDDDDNVPPPPPAPAAEAEAAAAAVKRRHDDDYDGGSDDDEVLVDIPPKRPKTESPTIKMEDADSPMGGHADHGSMEAAQSDRGKGTQFHFSVDEDSDLEDEQSADDNVRQQRTPPRTGGDAVEEGLPQGDASVRVEDVDEEDEELHMEVGKVYHRTLVQLGRAMGESIIG